MIHTAVYPSSQLVAGYHLVAMAGGIGFLSSYSRLTGTRQEREMYIMTFRYILIMSIRYALTFFIFFFQTILFWCPTKGKSPSKASASAGSVQRAKSIAGFFGSVKDKLMSSSSSSYDVHTAAAKAAEKARAAKAEAEAKAKKGHGSPTKLPSKGTALDLSMNAAAGNDGSVAPQIKRERSVCACVVWCGVVWCDLCLSVCLYVW